MLARQALGPPPFPLLFHTAKIEIHWERSTDIRDPFKQPVTIRASVTCCPCPSNSVTITHPQRQSNDFLPKPLTYLFLAALLEHYYQLGHHKNSENQSRAGRYTLRSSEFTSLILGTPLPGMLDHDVFE